MPRDTELKIVIKAKNEAEKAFKSVGKNLDTVKGKLEKHQKAFKAMTVAGIAAMGALTLAVGTAVKEAAIAEGAYAKFNTVFAEHADDMIEFVHDIRTRMPTATHEIVIMASGLQDLLVPMGIARGEAAEMTKKFLDLANQIAAFNDVSPEEVLIAIKSGLVGSSEPLKRFGVEARITTLESVAMKAGLIGVGETFAKLEPATRAQVTAQALLIKITNDSADAIAGFEANNDSFIRRSQGLQASIKETKKVLGDIFLPIVDDVLKKLLPLVEQIKEWVELNPELARNIIVVSAGVAGLVTALGALGLILPKIIALFGMLSLATGIWTALILAIIVVIGEFIAIGWILYNDWRAVLKGFKIMWDEHLEFMRGLLKPITDIINQMIETFKFWLDAVWERTVTIFTNVKDFLVGMVLIWADILAPIWKPFITATDTMSSTIKSIWQKLSEFIKGVWEGIKIAAQTVWDIIWGIIGNIVKGIEEDIVKALSTLKEEWEKMWDAIAGFLDRMWERLEKPLGWILGRLNSIVDAAKKAWQWAGQAISAVAKIGAGEVPLQHGGIVTRPTRALIGEAGPEAVIPLRRGFAGAGIGGITVNILGGTYLSEEVAEDIGNKIIDRLKLQQKF